MKMRQPRFCFPSARARALAARRLRKARLRAIAQIDGLLKIDREKLYRVNALGDMMIASRHGDFPVKAGDKIAGMRVIPLIIEAEKMVAGEGGRRRRPHLSDSSLSEETGRDCHHRKRGGQGQDQGCLWPGGAAKSLQSTLPRFWARPWWTTRRSISARRLGTF